ncbi:hypothetical protein [Planococcus lenghuensis]|uniref:Uncharacterized protein n=1 Tax=Planococcus lenghuensis TaxID=2213202 RepID=A0A1Q2KZD4_9BACL|nr:hypothetical protein [Planococcus lenghuensis]AQQ53551.1 hypothetical protein B0X71_11020 [Planococcus lenghuensis]
MKTPAHILELLHKAEKNGADLSSPKSVVTYWLTLGEKENILWFYKPNSVEFDFDKYTRAVREMKERKSD